VNYSFKLLRSSAARVITTLANIAVAFFLMPFVVRTLGDHSYGLWVVVSGIAFYYYLLDLGLSSAVTRYVAAGIARRDTSRVNQIVSTAVALFVGLGVIVALATVGLWLAVPSFLRPQDVGPIRVVVLLQGMNLALGFPFKAFGSIFSAQLRYDLVEMVNLALLVANTSLTVYVLLHGGGLVALACVTFGLGQAYNLTFYLVAKRLWPALSVRIGHAHRHVAKEMFGYSVWSFINHVSDMLRFRIDALVVARFCGASVVTHYSIGASLAEYGLNLINRATGIMTPLFVRYQADGDAAAVRSLLLFVTKVNAVLSIFGFGLLFVLGRLFIVRWMGSQYADAYLVFLVMGTALMLEGILQTAGNALYGLARHRPYAIAAVCEASANTVLSIFLARRYGMVGVAVGTAIPLAINKLLFTPYYTCRVVDLALWRFYVPILKTALVTGIFLLLLRTAVAHFSVPATYAGILLVLCVSVPAYLPVAFYGVLNAGERVMLRGLLPRVFSAQRTAEIAGG
jgi:O-antigen/teichoic acid export membrane protein